MQRKRERERDAQMHTQMTDLETGAVGDWGCLKRDTSKGKYVCAFFMEVLKGLGTETEAGPCSFLLKLLQDTLSQEASISMLLKKLHFLHSFHSVGPWKPHRLSRPAPGLVLI